MSKIYRETRLRLPTKPRKLDPFISKKAQTTWVISHLYFSWKYLTSRSEPKAQFLTKKTGLQDYLHCPYSWLVKDVYTHGCNAQFFFRYFFNIWLVHFCKYQRYRWNLSRSPGKNGLTLPMLKLLIYVQRTRKQRFLKTIRTLSCWYSLDSSHWVLSDEYQYARVSVIIQIFFA